METQGHDAGAAEQGRSLPILREGCWRHFLPTPTGMQVVGEPTFAEWSEAMAGLQRISTGIQWLIGDMMLYGEGRFGQAYSQVMEACDYEQQSCHNMQYVSREFGISRRREKLSWSHHAEVASLEESQQDRLLDVAEVQGLSTRELRQAVNQHKAAQVVPMQPCAGRYVRDLQILLDEGATFGTIYADPPWQYGNQATRAATDNHYQTMTIDQLAALPVARLAADYCHLHLWTTNAFLFECPKLLEAWGFTYQGVFVWCKNQIGIGNCWRVSHEFLLLAIKGEPRKFAARDLPSWWASDRGEHSAKPERVREMIERASPGPRLELFGRKSVDDWVVFGNHPSPNGLFTQHIQEERA